MTSGQFHTASIDGILIERDKRQRREPRPEKISDLADSIRRLGLIHPPVVTRDYVLVAGECRLLACKKLGWTHISVQFTDELEPTALLAIELEENVKRTDLPWQDQVDAVRKFHALMKSENPSWNQDKTAEAIGLSQQQTSQMLLVAEEIASGNKRVAEAPRFSTAEGIARRKREREDEQVLRGLKESIIGGNSVDNNEGRGSIITGDFRHWVIQHKAPRFNLIHCDFPYGIEADSFNQGSAGTHGGYIDTRETWESLMDALAVATETICTPSCHLMFWFAMRKGDERHYEPTVKALERMGWDINPLPLIWMKSDGAGIIPDPERGPRQIYETCLLGSRGDRKIVRAVANAYGAPTVRERHMSEKPEPMLRHFFQMLVDENTVMLDPTCGSGSALRAAESLNAKFVLGLEVNEEFAGLAREALEKSRRLKKAEEVVA